MKNWHETREVFAHIHANPDVVFALATVIGIEGSTYRRPGAKLLIPGDGPLCGNVSGGCLEEEIAVVGCEVIRDGSHRLLHYDTSMDEDTLWGLGLGCDGKVDVFVQAIHGKSSAVEDITKHIRHNRAFSIHTVVRGPDAGQQVVRLCNGDETPGGMVEHHLFCDVLRPPPLLVVCGAGDDAIPLVNMASQVGFRVMVMDHRRAYGTVERFPSAERVQVCDPLAWNPESAGIPFPSTLVVIMTHTLRYDEAWLKLWGRLPVLYLGLLGPKGRREELIKHIESSAQNRLYGPVGLDLGGEGAEQVALSVVAEALAVWHGRAGGHLRDRQTAIHANE